MVRSNRVNILLARLLFYYYFSGQVFFCGLPLQVLELAVGQYTREGPVEAMRSICPLVAGTATDDSLFVIALHNRDNC